MRHIIDKVITHLRETLLTEDNHDGEDESDKQHTCKDKCRYHELHT